MNFPTQYLGPFHIYKVNSYKKTLFFHCDIRMTCLHVRMLQIETFLCAVIFRKSSFDG